MLNFEVYIEGIKAGTVVDGRLIPLNGFEAEAAEWNGDVLGMSYPADYELFMDGLTEAMDLPEEKQLPYLMGLGFAAGLSKGEVYRYWNACVRNSDV